jgi:P4 family phage/plasmid primase-like protien
MSQGIAYQSGLKFLASSVPGANTPEIVRWRGQYYQWAGACYEPVTDEAQKAALTKWLAANPGARTGPKGKVYPVTTALIRDAMLAVLSEVAIPDDLAPGSWIKGPPDGAVGPFLATPCGVLDLGRLEEPAPVVWQGGPEFFALAALPVTPDPSAEYPNWRKFLAEVFPGDPAPAQIVQEIFAYSLWPDCRYEKFFIFPGPGYTGKSTVAATLEALLGKSNVSALPLERFGERFALAGLIGKMANIVFDASEIDRAAEGVLKALVSGEPVTVEEKHHPVSTMRLTAKHIFFTNVLPRFHDTSDGVWRRLLLQPFERVCPREQRDPDLKERLREELPAIAHWALQGLARLRRQGGFTPFERGLKLVNKYREESNPVALFLAAECVADLNGGVGRQAVYARYKEWAATNGHAPMSSTRFYSEVRALYPQPEEEVREGRGGDRMFVGFHLREANEVMRQFRVLSDHQAKGA